MTKYGHVWQGRPSIEKYSLEVWLSMAKYGEVRLNKIKHGQVWPCIVQYRPNIDNYGKI